MDFYSILSRYYDEIFPLSKECREFIQKETARDQKLLDAGCGTGELVLQLQKAGVQARGFDSDEGMILSAAAAAAQSGLPGNDLFKICDLIQMKSRYSESSQDVLTCLGNTMIHIPFNRQFRFLQDAGHILKPGGLLILQILNYSNILNDSMLFPLIETENCIFRRQYEEGEETSELNFVTELEIKSSGKTYRNSIVHYPLLPETLMAALSMSGYANWESYGSYKGVPPGKENLPLIVAARLPG